MLLSAAVLYMMQIGYFGCLVTGQQQGFVGCQCGGADMAIGIGQGAFVIAGLYPNGAGGMG